MTLRAVAVALTAAFACASAGCEQRYTPLDADGSVAAPKPSDLRPVARPAEPSTTTPPPDLGAPTKSAALPVGDDGSTHEYLAGDSDGKLHVWFFDVGQGDGILIQGPTGKTVLIDGGPEDAASHLSHRLPDLLRAPIDLVIATHPHPDHIGAMLKALSAVGAKRFVDIGIDAQTPEYLSLLHFLHERDITIFQPNVPPERSQEPFRIALGGGAELQVLWPRRPAEPFLESSRPLQANSLVARLVYQNTSLLFGADMTAETEQHLLDIHAPLRATVLKVPLHGADGATTQALLDSVKPEAAIISVGAGNSDGAPAHPVLARLEAAGAQVFRTDLDGEIRADSDGNSIVIVTERPAAGEAPDTPHLFGARNTEAGQKLAQAVVEDVVKKRPAIHHPEPAAPLGKTTDARATSRAAHETRDARSTSGRSDGGPFVASRNSDVFHVPSCPWAKRIKKKNLITFSSRREAEASGRRAAGDCHP